MAKRQFTEEELAFLRRNPYTAYVDANTLSFTVAFKAEFMRLYSEGIPPREILPRLGYPIEIIGKPRLNGISQKIRMEAVSEIGFREAKHNKTGPLFDASPEEQAVLTDRQMKMCIRDRIMTVIMIAFFRQVLPYYLMAKNRHQVKFQVYL